MQLSPFFCWSMIVLILFITTIIALLTYLGIKTIWKKKFDCTLELAIYKDLKITKLTAIKRYIVIRVLQLYLPTRVSAIILSLTSILFLYLSRQSAPTILLKYIGIECTPPQKGCLTDTLIFDQSNQFQNLIAIHAGIGAIIFAVFIFIAENLREDSERARVLLKASMLYPLTVLELLVFLIYLWGNVSFVVIFITIFMCGFTIYSVSQILRLLIDRPLFLKKERELLKDRVKLNINEALKLRVGNNIYLKKLEDDEFDLEWSPMNEQGEDMISIKLSKTGFIRNINLCEIDNLINYLEKLANKQNYSFKATKKSLDEESLVVDGVRETKQKEYKKLKGHILKKFGDEITDDNKHALVIPKILNLEDEEKHQIQNIVDKIFILSKTESVNEKLKDELSRKKDAAIEAIRSGKQGRLDEIADTYIDIIESFQEVLKQVGGKGYTQEQAMQERGSIFGGWNEIRWVTIDLIDLLNESIKTEDRRIIDIISKIVYSISFNAIKIKDHLTFQEFIRFQHAKYHFAQNIKDTKIKTDVVNNSWRELKEICTFYIETQIDKPDKSEDDIKEYKDFIVDILQVVLQFLKATFDNKDLKTFTNVKNQMMKLLSSFHPSRSGMDVRTYRVLLKNEDLPEEKRKEYEIKLNKQEFLENIEKEVKILKQELVFGIAAWIFSKYRSSNFQDQNFKEFWEQIKISLPDNLKELTEVYIGIRRRDADRLWGMSWWEFEGKEEGVAISVDTHEKIEWVYVVRALELATNLSDEHIKTMEIAVDSEFAIWIKDPNGGINKKLEQIKGDIPRWLSTLAQISIDKIEPIKALFQHLGKVQEQKEREELIKANVDSSKIQTFFKQFRISFYEAGVFRKLFTKNNIYKEYKRRSKVSTTIQAWGFNQIDDKAVFTEDSYSVKSWAEHYGQGLADAEDEKIYKDILNNVEEYKSQKENLDEIIIEAIKELTDKGFKPSIIISSLYPGDFQRTALKSNQFVQKFQSKSIYNKIPTFIGEFKHEKISLPIFDSPTRNKRDEEQELIILDLKSFAQLKQFPPYDNDEEKVYKEDIFYGRIINLSKDDEMRNKIIAENPGWLQTYSNPGEYLREKVIIKILEKFNLVIKEKRAGVKILLKFDEH